MHKYQNRKTGYVILGARTGGTKVKRVQSVASSLLYAIAALRFLYLHTQAGEFLLAGADYVEFRTFFQRANVMQGIQDLHFTLHGPRSGGATEDLINGMSFPEVQEKGRWLAAGSCRVYLDRAKALAQGTIKRSSGFSVLVADPTRVGNIFRFQ